MSTKGIALLALAASLALAGCPAGGDTTAAKETRSCDPDERLPSGVCLLVNPASGPGPRRDRAKLVALSGGIAFLIGGHDENGAVATCDRFDESTAGWTPCPPLPEPRDGIGAAFRFEVPAPVYEDETGHDKLERVLALGGSSFRREVSPKGASFKGSPFATTAPLFDVEKNAWSLAEAKVAGSFSGTATPVDSGRVILTTYPASEKPRTVVRGGRLFTEISTAVYVYSTLSGSFVPAHAGPRNHDGGGATRLVDGRVLLDGPADIDVYDPAADAWTYVAPSGLAGSERPVLAPLDSFRILAVGGRTPGPTGAARHDAEIVDLRGGQVAVQGPPGESSPRFVAVAAAGTMFVWAEERIPGSGQNAGTSLLSRFDPLRSAWETLRLPIPVDTPMGVALDDGAVLFLDAGTRASFVVTAVAGQSR